MKTGNLISSLFKENSFSNRSAMMYQRSFSPIQNTLQRPLSQSGYTGRTYRYLTLDKMVNIFASKIQLINKSFFSLLQTYTIEYQLQDNFAHDYQYGENCSLMMEEEESKSNLQMVENVKKGLHRVCSIANLSEINHHNKEKISFAFLKLKNINNKFLCIQIIVNYLQKTQHQNMKQVFQTIKNNDQYILKYHPIISTLIKILTQKLKKILLQISQSAKKQPKIKRQTEQRQKKQKYKFIDITLFQVPTVNSRLIAIKQQNSSSVISDEDNNKFVTPLKNHYNSHDLVFDQDLSDSKVDNKLQQLRNGFINRKSNFKSSQFPQEDSSYDTCSIAKQSCQQSRVQKQKICFKPTTKIQPHKSKIHIKNGYRIQTVLEDNNVIVFNHTIRNNQNQYMFKYNRLYAESIIEPLPDLHDNMGVFQHSADDNNYNEQHIISHRNIDKYNNKCTSTQSKRRVRLSKHKKREDEYQHVRTQNKQIYSPEMNYSNVTKQSFDFVGIGQNIKSQPHSQGINKYNIDNVNNKNNYIGTSARQNTTQSMNFCSSPLNKIQEMMIDLQKLRERQKFGCGKPATGFQKCKISINLPSRKGSEERYCQDVGNKVQYTSSSKNINQYPIKKKQQSQKYKTKQSWISKQNSEPRDNIEYKLLNEKNKYKILYNELKQNKISRQKKNSMITQNQINTARRMKKQIQNIINGRKNVMDVNDNKFGKNKF